MSTTTTAAPARRPGRRPFPWTKDARELDRYARELERRAAAARDAAAALRGKGTR